MARRLSPVLATLASAVGLLCAALDAGAGNPTDPTRPADTRDAQTAPAARSAPVVSAVFIASERRVAIVDGLLVRAGDRIRDLQIDAILDDGIRYTRDGTSALSHLPKRTVAVRSAPTTQARLGDKEQ